MTDFREIVVSDRDLLSPAQVDAGAVPELRWLAIDDLRVDEGYQRPLGPANWAAIRKIAKGFNWGKFTPVMAAPIVGGGYALIDGQHRSHAARMAGFTHVPAMIVVLSRGDQAASFSAVNGSTIAISAFHVYRAALTAGEDWAIRSRDAVAAAGCTLMESNPSFQNRKPGQVFSIVLIRKHIEMGRDAFVTAALRAIHGSEEALVEHFAHGVLSGWMSALQEDPQRFGKIDWQAFCRQHDLVSTYEGVAAMRKKPEFRDRALSSLYRDVLVAQLHSFGKGKAVAA